MVSEFLAEWSQADESGPALIDADALESSRFFAVVDSMAKAARAESHPDLDWPAAYEGLDVEGEWIH